MSKFIKYRIIEENGVQYDCYIAADMIKGVAPVYIKNEEGIRLKAKENACVLITRDNQRIETDNAQEEIMAQLAPEMVYGGKRRISPQFINAMAFGAALNNLATVYVQAAEEAEKTKNEYQKVYCNGKAFAIQQAIIMAQHWQDKPTEEE